jgi:predicted O-methyltransferase YrrM
LIIIIILIIFKIIFRVINKNKTFQTDEDLDKFEVYFYDKIKQNIENSKCSIMWANQRQFLNGAVRKFKPKKILEVGVHFGGGSSIILNAIRDMKDSHLYSIDINPSNSIGKCVKQIVPELESRWTLFQGFTSAKFMEQIGNEIDMVFFDTKHYEPGEILDFLLVFPFLSKNALVGFHDIGNQILTNYGRREWAPYIIFNLIKGKKYLPSGKGNLIKDIGFIKLEKDQEPYIHDYCRALGGQWEYVPNEIDIYYIREIFSKYYDNECRTIFEEAYSFNKEFVKNYPINKTSNS